MKNVQQRTLFDCQRGNTTIPNVWGPRDTDFLRNLSLPIHRWFRFPAGFSAGWVRTVIEWCMRRHGWSVDHTVVLDPFAGSGTAILAAEEVGAKAYGVEAHPFLAKIAQAKLAWKHVDLRKLENHALEVLRHAKSKPPPISDYPRLIKRMYPSRVLRDLHSLRLAWESHADGSFESRLVWLAITAILRQTSDKGTAPWQYALPRKRRKRFTLPYEAFERQLYVMIQDIRRFRSIAHPTGDIIHGDIRYTQMIPRDSVSLVITSPPYANNYDYADAVRLELSFWGEVTQWRDLHNKVRKYLMRSCTQHMTHDDASLEELLDGLKDTAIYQDVKRVCSRLARERLKHGGRKQYHRMIAAYFHDLYLAWRNLRGMCKDNCVVAVVIGDSAPYGVHVPVDDWLGRLAISAGFHSYHFDKVKDRNVKWKNRKHRVPLKEGILWVTGGP